MIDSYSARHGCELTQSSMPTYLETPMKRSIALLLLALFTAGSMSACNTVRGAGQDVQKVGEKMEDSAENTGGTSRP